MEGVGDPPDVAAVAERQDREERDPGVLRGVEGAEEVLAELAQGLLGRPRRRPPEADGLELHRRQLERRLVDRLLTVDALALEADHPLGDLEAAEPGLEGAEALLLQHLEDLGLLLGQGRREVVEVRRLRLHPPLLVLEGGDQELPPGVEIDRPRVALVEGAHAVDRADRPPAGEDGEGLPRPAQVDVALRPGGAGEDLVPLGGGEQVPLAQQLLDPRLVGGEIGAVAGISSVERHLGGAADQVRARHRVVVRIDDQPLAGALEELLGMVEEVLVEGVGHRHHGGDRLAPVRAHPPRALPGGHHAAGVADQDAGVEAADVDPHLERRGGDHAVEVAREQLPLDPPPLLGEEAGAVARDAPGGAPAPGAAARSRAAR